MSEQKTEAVPDSITLRETTNNTEFSTAWIHENPELFAQALRRDFGLLAAARKGFLVIAKPDQSARIKELVEACHRAEKALITGSHDDLEIAGWLESARKSATPPATAAQAGDAEPYWRRRALAIADAISREEDQGALLKLAGRAEQFLREIAQPAPEQAAQGVVDAVQLRELIASDAYASSFQSLGQYRAAILSASEGAR